MFFLCHLISGIYEFPSWCHAPCFHYDDLTDQSEVVVLPNALLCFIERLLVILAQKLKAKNPPKQICILSTLSELITRIYCYIYIGIFTVCLLEYINKLSSGLQLFFKVHPKCIPEPNWDFPFKAIQQDLFNPPTPNSIPFPLFIADVSTAGRCLATPITSWLGGGIKSLLIHIVFAGV